MKTTLLATAALICTLLLPGCLTKRTVTEGGHTVSEKYVIKRPIKEAVRNSQ